jgi:hypothetical protein
MADIDEQIQKLREHVPDDKTDDELRALIEEAGGDEVRLLFSSIFFFPAAGGSACVFSRAALPHSN